MFLDFYYPDTCELKHVCLNGWVILFASQYAYDFSVYRRLYSSLGKYCVFCVCAPMGIKYTCIFIMTLVVHPRSMHYVCLHTTVCMYSDYLMHALVCMMCPPWPPHFLVVVCMWLSLLFLLQGNLNSKVARQGKLFISKFFVCLNKDTLDNNIWQIFTMLTSYGGLLGLKVKNLLKKVHHLLTCH